MLRIIAVATPPFSLLCFALLSFAQVAQNAPAFSPSLRVDSVFGDWRAVPSAALYGRSEYHLQLGYAFLFGDVATIMTGEDDIVSEQQFEDRILQAASLLEESLEAQPGRVEGWTGMAWARFLLGQSDRSQDALAASWNLAPFNANQALERLSLLAALRRSAGWTSAEMEWSRFTAQQDLTVLEMYRRQLFVLFHLTEGDLVEAFGLADALPDGSAPSRE